MSAILTYLPGGGTTPAGPRSRQADTSTTDMRAARAFCPGMLSVGAPAVQAGRRPMPSHLTGAMLQASLGHAGGITSPAQSSYTRVVRIEGIMAANLPCELA